MRRRKAIAVLAGGVLLGPIATRAQTGKLFRIAYLALLAGEDSTLGQAFLQRLQELGYAGGKSLIFDYRSADDRPQRLPELAAELVRANPDLLVAGFGTLTAKAARAATTNIPIVFTGVADPIAAGLVASLNRPSANLTGIAGQGADIAGKRLQILVEFISDSRMIAVLMNPDTPASAVVLSELRAAAESLHRRLQVFKARTADEVSSAIDGAVKAGAAGLLTVDDPLILGLSRQVAELAARARLPAMFSSRVFVAAGGLMSYGTDRRQLSRRAAELADKILKGAKPADIPVEQPTKFELVINLKTARALNLTVPQALLARADEVIE